MTVKELITELQQCKPEKEIKFINWEHRSIIFNFELMTETQNWVNLYIKRINNENKRTDS